MMTDGAVPRAALVFFWDSSLFVFFFIPLEISYICYENKHSQKKIDELMFFLIQWFYVKLLKAMLKLCHSIAY